jgi:hypothetical protein
VLRTYKAILQGDHVEWIDRPPEVSRPVQVHITVLDEGSETAGSRGQAMAAILETLAASGGLSGIADPRAWQREVRQERALPDRNE